MKKFLIFFGIVFLILPAIINWDVIVPMQRVVLITSGSSLILFGYLTMPKNLVERYFRHLEEERFLKEREEVLKVKNGK